MLPIRSGRPLKVTLISVLTVLPCGDLWTRFASCRQEAPAEAPPEEQSEKYLGYLEGHSHHGEAFNEGPRQAAYLMGGTGDIHFEVTTDSDEVAALFDQGMGQLHGFWYFEAERTFRQVAALQPDCAMAYWGMAMANFDNEERAPGFAQEAWKRRAGVSDRERQHVEAIARYFDVNRDEEPAEPADETGEKGGQETESANKVEEPAKTKPKESREEKQKRRKRFIQDLETIVHDYPDDIETKALLVNQLWLDRRVGISTPSRQANQALLDQVFAANPMHPSHHYKVHLWDSKETAYRALDSAAVIGQSAPSIAHMWHMGGHIFAQLDRHGDAAWQQEASARTDHAQMMRDRVLPDEIMNYAHNNEWLCRSLRHVGRVRESIELAKNMIELPRHPRINSPEKRGGSANYGRQRLMDALNLFELWSEAVELAHTMYLEPSSGTEDSLSRLALLARAHIELGQPEQAEAQIVALEQLLAEVRQKRSAAADEAEEEALEADRKPAEVDEAIAEAMKPKTAEVRQVRQAIEQLRALSDFRGAFDDADRQLALESLKEGPMKKPHLAMLHLEAGLPEEAVRLAREAAEAGPGEAYPWATLAYVLAAAGQVDEAKQAFETLRAFSGRFEMNLQVFDRLVPLARQLGHGVDWRIEDRPADDVGDRVDLARVGPFRWAPVAAPEFTLPDGLGNEVSLADYLGRPVLVIFFLGFGCVHCVEQLGAFSPMAENYAKAGIPILTIGTDSIEDLAGALSGDDEDAFPFPILSDPELVQFKRYRAYDDFEKMALHGTFLVDGNGLTRWQDISYEPFMDAEWLLEESQRLLGLPVIDSATGRRESTSGTGQEGAGAGR